MQIPRRLDLAGNLEADQKIEDRILTETNEFAKLAERIRKAFFNVYNYFNNLGESKYGQGVITQWDGGENRGKVFQPIWNKIAHYLIKNGISNVERFVYAQFTGRTNKKLFPTHLLGQSALKLYNDYDQFADNALEARLLSDITIYKQQHKLTKGNIDGILMDNSNEISPLFRYILAKTENRKEVLPSLLPLAKIQFSLDPKGYLSVWGKFLSLELFRDLQNIGDSL